MRSSQSSVLTSKGRTRHSFALPKSTEPTVLSGVGRDTLGAHDRIRHPGRKVATEGSLHAEWPSAKVVLMQANACPHGEHMYSGALAPAR